MSRYIDADALEEIKEIADDAFEWGTYVVKMSAIREQPTADVVEVKHGEWIVCDAPPPTWWYECSICHKAGNVEYNFCPNCGADMRERREDDKGRNTTSI